MVQLFGWGECIQGVVSSCLWLSALRCHYSSVLRSPFSPFLWFIYKWLVEGFGRDFLHFIRSCYIYAPLLLLIFHTFANLDGEGGRQKREKCKQSGSFCEKKECRKNSRNQCANLCGDRAMREGINHRNIPKYECNEFPNNAGAKSGPLFGDFSVVFVWIEIWGGARQTFPQTLRGRFSTTKHKWTIFQKKGLPFNDKIKKGSFEWLAGSNVLRPVVTKMVCLTTVRWTKDTATRFETFMRSVDHVLNNCATVPKLGHQTPMASNFLSGVLWQPWHKLFNNDASPGNNRSRFSPMVYSKVDCRIKISATSCATQHFRSR